MSRFLIYRHGSNAANQHLCNKMAVAIVRAESVEDARRVAEENVVFYANQTSEAVSEADADPADWNFVCDNAAESDLFFVS